MEIHIKKGLDALQTETVLRLLSQTVWACNRKKEAIMESWKHSICYGAYTADGKQIGFARVITDYATQYYGNTAQKKSERNRRKYDKIYL